MAWNILCLFIYLYNKDICYFSSLLANLDHFLLTSTISATVLLLEVVVIRHGLATTWFHACTGKLESQPLADLAGRFGGGPPGRTSPTPNLGPTYPQIRVSPRISATLF